MNLRKKIKNSYIKKSLYRKITGTVPLLCVDLIVVSGGKFLLGKRVNQPAKSQWFLPGGRVFRNETLRKAAFRVAESELGFVPKSRDLNLLGVGEVFFKSKNPDADRHCVSVIFVLNLKRQLEFDFDRSQHSRLKLFSAVNRNWHPYVKRTLKKAGFE